MTLNTNLLALALGAAALAPAAVQAKDCLILLHGHTGSHDPTQDIPYANVSDEDHTYGYKYWRKDLTGDFITPATQNGAMNHGVVRWNGSDDAHLAYWQDKVLGTVVSQIMNITAGLGDLYTHAGQCTATDRFFIVAHSQGAQVISYINANAYPGAKFYNKAIKLDDVTLQLGPTTLASSATVAMPFSTVMSKITAVITMGGAINGSQGMDITCDSGPIAGLMEVFGPGCTRSLSTPAVYNPSTNSGAKMLKPMYMFGGTGSFPVPLNASSLLLDGEDDGTVNLASQLNCAGSPTRDLEQDFREYYAGFPIFSCNNANKRHSNTFNVGSFDQHHESERGSISGTVAHASAADVMSCGANLDMSRTIPACLTAGKIK